MVQQLCAVLSQQRTCLVSKWGICRRNAKNMQRANPSYHKLRTQTDEKQPRQLRQKRGSGGVAALTNRNRPRAARPSFQTSDKRAVVAQNLSSKRVPTPKDAQHAADGVAVPMHSYA
ncbi:hypothetical protein TRVL_08361 [Trypanosoma vivax]|nr:hypothetical protein TRVL_08361 [Trypanosoma vivax]